MHSSQHRPVVGRQGCVFFRFSEEPRQVMGVAPLSPKVSDLYQSLMLGKWLHANTSASIEGLQIDPDDWEAFNINTVTEEEDGCWLVVSSAHSELTTLVSEGQAANPQAELVEFIKSLRQLIAKGNFDTLKLALSYFAKNDGVRPQKVIAAFRTAYSVRQKLSRWDSLVATAKSTLISRGEDGDDLLRGL